MPERSLKKKYNNKERTCVLDQIDLNRTVGGLNDT